MSDALFYAVVIEDPETASIECVESFDTRDAAVKWINDEGLEGVAYWICRPESRHELTKGKAK